MKEALVFSLKVWLTAVVVTPLVLTPLYGFVPIGFILYGFIYSIPSWVGLFLITQFLLPRSTSIGLLKRTLALVGVILTFAPFMILFKPFSTTNTEESLFFSLILPSAYAVSIVSGIYFYKLSLPKEVN